MLHTKNNKPVFSARGRESCLFPPSRGRSCSSRGTSLLSHKGRDAQRLYGASRCTGRKLARMRSSSLGPVDGFPGLQTAICYETTEIQRCFRVSYTGRGGFGVTERNLRSFNQESYQSGPKRGKPAGFLLPVLPHSKEGGRTASYSGPPCIEQSFEKIHIQNVNTQGIMSVYPPERLVCDNRLGRCIFPRRYSPDTQEISQVCASGHNLRVSSAPVWAVTSPAGIHQVCGRSVVSVKEQRRQDIFLHRRLSGVFSLTRTSHQRRREGDVTPHESGFQNKLDQEPIAARTMHGLSGSQHKLPLMQSHSVGGEDSGIHTVFGSLPAGSSGAVQTLPEAVRSDGISDRCSETGPSYDERRAKMGDVIETVPAPSSLPLGESFTGSNSGSLSVAQPGDFFTGGASRGRGVEGRHDDGRVPDRVGSGSRGQSSERCLALRTSSGSHKLSGAFSSVSGSETFCTAPQGQTCPVKIRQHHSGGVYQPSGGHSVFTTAQTSSQDHYLEQFSARVATGDARSRSTEQRCRSPVKRKSSVRGVETPSPSGFSGVSEVRPGCRRSVRIAGKRTVSSVLLPVGRGGAIGRGRAGPSVARRSALCVPPPQPDLPHTSQSKGAGPVINTDSATMAIQTLGSGDSTATIRPAVAPPTAQGPPVPGTGRDLPPPSRPGGALGLARERLNLDAVGLPPEVIDTIQCARASSTRSLYSGKWRAFERWCDERQVVSFQCSVRDILCFLQYLLDRGKAFSTIKVYVAAISACHIGFGDRTPGQHPLVSSFMKGVRRKRPVSRPLIPLWDLSGVLEALTQHPFEPLGVVELKFLSLKTALLLAVTTAKRVSDLQALSTRPACLQFAPGGSKVCLRPNPAFIPKVVESAYRCPTVELGAFHPPPFQSAEDRKLNTLCPVRALQVYVDRTAGFRRSDQLFVSWATAHKGKPLSRQRLSHWIVEAIELAYRCRGLQPPPGLKAHSTRGMATSWALFKGVRVEDICAAASWATPHTFVRFYRLDVSDPSLAHAVLETGASQRVV